MPWGRSGLFSGFTFIAIGDFDLAKVQFVEAIFFGFTAMMGIRVGTMVGFRGFGFLSRGFGCFAATFGLR